MLAESEAGAKKQLKAAKSLPSSTRYPAATEWELLQTDATILHALTLALKYVSFLTLRARIHMLMQRVVYGIRTMLLRAEQVHATVFVVVALANSIASVIARTPSSLSTSLHSLSHYVLSLLCSHRLFKTVFPSGVDDYATPATSQATSPAPSIRSETSSTNTAKQQARSGYGLLGSIGRFGGSLLSAQPVANPVASLPEGPIEELIMSGTAFGECHCL